MASDEEIFDKPENEDAIEDEIAKMMEEFNLGDEIPGVSESEDSDETLSEFGAGNREEFINIDEIDSLGLLEEFPSSDEEFPTEEVLDMDEIDAILSDISDVHPERNKSAKELEDRIAKYEENPEAAEEALLEEARENEDTEETGIEPSEEISASDDSGSDQNLSDDDFLSTLENVEDLLAEVENKAREEDGNSNAEIIEGQDADVDEINDILKKSDNNEAVNDDLLSMIEGLDNVDNSESEGMFDDDSKEETEEGKKEKKAKKKKKKKAKGEAEAETEEGSEGEDLEFENKDTNEKKGFFAGLLGFIFDEGDEEAEEGEGTEKAEGEEAKGKKKKDKKGKGKGKGKGSTPADENAAIEAELEEEDKKAKKKKKKDKKDKKPAKASKPKKEKKVEEEEETKSGIKKPGIVVSMFFCVTVLAIVLLAAVAGPKLIARKEAAIAYYEGDYETASNKLYGLKLNKSDELIYRKSSLLFRLELFLEKADAYEISGDDTKCLDSLFAAYSEAEEIYPVAKDLNITEEVDVFKDKVVKKIKDKYGLSRDDIAIVCEMKPVYYTIAVENIIAGRDYRENTPEAIKEETNEAFDVEENEETKEAELEDLLPEEKLINR